MKFICMMFFIFSTAFNLNAQTDSELMRALNYGANADIKILVKDQDGEPVKNAIIKAAFLCDYSSGGNQEINVITGNDGSCIVRGKSTGKFKWNVSKDGYYVSSGEWNLVRSKSKKAVAKGKWLPYGDTREITIRKMLRPGELQVVPRKIYGFPIPKFDEWLGFDLEMYDWMAPHGKGRFSDVCLKFSSTISDKFNEYKHEMYVSFTNNPHAGVYMLNECAESELKTDYVVNTNKMFRQTLVFAQKKTPDALISKDYLSQGKYLVYRTRTSVDRDGKLTSAHYGTILGPWVSTGKFMIMHDGCFNPKSNDINIEDGRNLRKRILGRKKSNEMLK